MILFPELKYWEVTELVELSLIMNVEKRNLQRSYLDVELHG